MTKVKTRRPTRKEKERIAKAGLDWREWNVIQGMGAGRFAIAHKKLGGYKGLSDTEGLKVKARWIKEA